MKGSSALIAFPVSVSPHLINSIDDCPDHFWRAYFKNSYRVYIYYVSNLYIHQHVEYYSMLAFIAQSEADQVVLATMNLWATIIGYIGMLQATLHSTGIDWIIWPSLLIIAWWVLIGRTWTILKLVSLPVIAVATYFVLFISYHAIINLS